MKRTFLFILAAVLLGAAMQSCDTEDNNGNNNGGNNNGGGNGNGTTSSVQWVDLGLPSGLLWADRNVGASSPEVYGNYYAWGETAPKGVYNWSTYAYGKTSRTLTKYCTMSNFGHTDNLTTLEASDDAATVNLGGGARTPTNDEWQELLDNTTSSWTTQNGIPGCLLTASNGNSVFLPAAGGRFDSDFGYTRERGYYWSSSLYTNYPDEAWLNCFHQGGMGMISQARRDGFPIRAVR